MKSTVRIYDFDYTLGDSHRCPHCGKKNFCKMHRYTYLGWYEPYKTSMAERASRYPELFPEDDWQNPN